MKAYMIIDGQWGSTGKGLLCGHLARKWRPDTVVCNFGPNAGHTWRSSDRSGLVEGVENKVIVKQLPMGIISPSVRHVLIGPGAVIDPEILVREIIEFAPYLGDKQIRIHPNAAVVNSSDKEVERNNLARISSTQKGTGAALSRKIMRDPEAIAGGSYIVKGNTYLQKFLTTHDEYMDILYSSHIVQIESAQGLELSLNCGSNYPYCTSRDITPMQVLADTLIHPCWLKYIIATMRTYPIRVGDQYQDGVKVGTSGPVYPDQRELTWAELGQPEEITTVTGKIRRVFTWSDMNLRKVLTLIKPDAIFLNFTNYMTVRDAEILINHIDDISMSIGYMGHRKSLVRWEGVGPNDEDVRELFGEEWI